MDNKINDADSDIDDLANNVIDNIADNTTSDTNCTTDLECGEDMALDGIIKLYKMSPS